MSENDTKWEVSNYPPHMQMDAERRNHNIDKGHVLCERCDGTGNELYSMYRACTDCGGSGQGDGEVA